MLRMKFVNANFKLFYLLFEKVANILVPVESTVRLDEEQFISFEEAIFDGTPFDKYLKSQKFKFLKIKYFYPYGESVATSMWSW